MKPRFLLCLALAGACVPVCAQAPVGSRALSGAEALRQLWPAYSRPSASAYIGPIKGLQFLLRNVGVYRRAPDGVFGSATQHAVKAFQRANGLKSDGIVGTQTWAKLCPRLKRGDQGEAVRALQTLLNWLQKSGGQPIYGRLKVNGHLGFETERALRGFQRDYRLDPDGVAGVQTWASLVSTGHGDD